MNVCYDQAGRNIGLADHALASGGEGAVYEIVGYPRKVVKKYHHGADAKKREDKIREMVKISASNSFSNAKLAQDVAWPLSQVYDQGHNFIGFGMNKIGITLLKKRQQKHMHIIKTNIIMQQVSEMLRCDKSKHMFHKRVRQQQR